MGIPLNKLTDKAWEPCAQYYEELKIVKLSNAKGKRKNYR